ncbi:MAE_28990/MAE_18760 family HEPN-like nuclease [Microbacterium esteraromaticum]|uniref:MAE_28990/MAE_18760 family HEPN-like nuclease n=1 Tax=Microbacterium esteraromaticum TaxID=57043 RepID=UPI0037C70313
MIRKPLSITSVQLGDAAASRISAWRQNLTALASDGIAGVSESDFLGCELRAAATVAALAELERMLRELLVATADEVNSASVKVRDLVPALRGLASQAQFQAIAESSKSDQHWEGRQLVTRLELSEEIARLPVRSSSTPQPPLDGRTIRAAHLQRLWTVLGLPEQAIPRAPLEVSLNALSTLRNDIAHGNAPIGELFHPDVPGKSARQIEAHLENLERLIDHVALAFHEYGKSRLYRISA